MDASVVSVSVASVTCSVVGVSSEVPQAVSEEARTAAASTVVNSFFLIFFSSFIQHKKYSFPNLKMSTEHTKRAGSVALSFQYDQLLVIWKAYFLYQLYGRFPGSYINAPLSAFPELRSQWS
jgi:hypothetical protein